MSDKHTLSGEQYDEPAPEYPNAKPIPPNLRVVGVKYDNGFPQPVFGTVEIEYEQTGTVHYADELANRLTATEARLAAMVVREAETAGTLREMQKSCEMLGERLAALTQERDKAVAIAREAVEGMERFALDDEDYEEVVALAARLAKIGGEG